MDIKRNFAKAMRVLLQPPALTQCRLDKRSKVCSGTQMNYSVMEKYSYIGYNCFVLNAHIGSFVSIADNCRIGGASHPIERVSGSPVFHKGKNILKKNFADFENHEAENITIGNDVWIGAGATVMSGVTIGTGAVIGAGSIVTKDVPPYEIWVGNPAHKLRDRFNDDIKEGLLNSEWWNWPEEKIEKYACLFDDPEKFLESITGENE